MKILSFGEILWDVYPDKKFIGGAPLNFAAHLAKQGEEAYMLSAVGCDNLGDGALLQLKNWGINCKYVACLDDKQTGACNVTLDDNSVPKYDLLQNVAYDYIGGNRLDEVFDVLYFGTLALRSEHNRGSVKSVLEQNSFGHVFVDVNIRSPFYTAQTVRFAVSNATILKISLEELDTVAQLLNITDYAHNTQFAKMLAKAYPALKCVIVTLGGDGAYALDCTTGKDYSCGCANVKVASTVGAGDSFSAAFLHKYLHNHSLEECLSYASQIAGIVVSHYEAVPDYDIAE